MIDILSPLNFLNTGAQFNAVNECVGSTNDPNFTFTVSGTGAAFSTLANGANNAIGILRLALGTVATNRGSIASPNFGVLKMDGGATYFAAMVRFPTLSDATNTFTFRAGFIDSITAESVDAVCFRYTNGVNSGKFQTVTRSNNVETTADSGITVAANVWYKLEIVGNAAGTSIVFKINGVTVATMIATIPTGTGRETGFGIFVLRSLGTAAVNALDVDTVAVQKVLTVSR